MKKMIQLPNYFKTSLSLYKCKIEKKNNMSFQLLLRVNLNLKLNEMMLNVDSSMLNIAVRKSVQNCISQTSMNSQSPPLSFAKLMIIVKKIRFLLRSLDSHQGIL